MNNISISKIKQIREDLGATHLVLFAIDKNGTQHVATHGETAKQSKEAARAGNSLKEHLNWDKHLCKAEPLERKCGNCFFWKADYGYHCFNGWTKDGSTGFCRWEPKQIQVKKEDVCSFFEPNC